MTDNSGGSNFSARSAINIIDYLYQLRYALILWSFALAIDIFLLEHGLDGLIFLQLNTITYFQNASIIFIFLTIYALFMSITIPLCNAVLSWLLDKWLLDWLKDGWDLITKSEYEKQKDREAFFNLYGNRVHWIKVREYSIKEKDLTAMNLYNDEVSSYHDSMKEYTTIMNLCLSCSILMIYNMY